MVDGALTRDAGREKASNPKVLMRRSCKGSPWSDFWKALIWSAATSLKVSKRSEVFVVAVKDSLTEAGLDDEAGSAAGAGAGAAGDAGAKAEAEAATGAAAAGVCGSISSTAEEKRTAAAGASRGLLELEMSPRDDDGAAAASAVAFKTGTEVSTVCIVCHRRRRHRLSLEQAAKACLVMPDAGSDQADAPDGPRGEKLTTNGLML